MFVFNHTPETQVTLDFSKALNFLDQGKLEDARMFISHTIEHSDPYAVRFCKDLEEYSRHDTDFVDDISSLMELYTAPDFKQRRQQQEAQQPSTPQTPPLVPPSINQKLELAISIQNLLKDPVGINTDSEYLRQKVTAFLEEELKQLFGQEPLTLTKEEVFALKQLAKKLI